MLGLRLLHFVKQSTWPFELNEMLNLVSAEQNVPEAMTVIKIIMVLAHGHTSSERVFIYLQRLVYNKMYK